MSSPPTSTQAAPCSYERGLCQRCREMLQEEGFATMRTVGFIHSPVRSFAEREKCLFCQYLWTVDLEGTSPYPSSFRSLSDVVEPSDTDMENASSVIPIVVRFFLSEDVTTKRDMLNFDMQRQDGLPLDENWARPVFYLHLVEPQELMPLHDLRCTSNTGPSLTSNGVASVFPLWKFDWNRGPSYMGKALRHMLATCEDTHEECRRSQPQKLPTRMLRVSSHESRLRIQLYASVQGETGRYAALSYCWGGSQDFQLTTNNLVHLERDGFDSRLLPKTLEDAVTVTHRLGLEYLWIDALCIIQDDPGDRDREIERMYSIYENSYVTLVAAMSKSVNDGFLEPTSRVGPFDSPLPAIRLPLVSKAGKHERDIALLPFYRLYTSMHPINYRGWTFQESFIPNRLIVFGDPEPFLRCRRNDVVSPPGSCVHYANSHIQPERNELNPEEHRDFPLIWDDIVDQYSSRTFSIMSDRTVAMKGVIELLQRQYGGECHHGVWTTHAVGCLLWAQREVDELNPSGSLHRLAGVPTWSWQSLPTRVWLSSRLCDDTCDYKAIIDFEGPLKEILAITTWELPFDEINTGTTVWWNDPTSVSLGFGEERCGRPVEEEPEQLLVLLHRANLKRLIVLRVVDEGLNMHRRVALMCVDKVKGEWGIPPLRQFLVR